MLMLQTLRHPYVIGGGVLILAAAALLVYIFLFIFLSGSHATGAEYDKFIMDICSPSGSSSFFKTVLTFGYFKRSFKNFYTYYKVLLFPVPTATLGGPCPDAKLVALDGTATRLQDYIDSTRGIPLILNMGSYT